MVYDFIKEIQYDTEVPVLVLIDDINLWDQISQFLDPHTTQVTKVHDTAAAKTHEYICSISLLCHLSFAVFVLLCLLLFHFSQFLLAN